ncbi:hypothetical protein CXU21_07505 [Akkermansia muciniphila]|nr:hypothetical protein CXU21_07505 [Akkermansia muciniphila]
MESVSGKHGRERIFCARLCSEKRADKQSVFAGYEWKRRTSFSCPASRKECGRFLRQRKKLSAREEI